MEYTYVLVMLGGDLLYLFKECFNSICPITPHVGMQRNSVGNEKFPIGSRIWMPGLQLAVLSSKVIEPSGGSDLIEEVYP